MTKVLVYRLQNKKTGLYLVNIDTSSLSITFGNPGMIFSTEQQFQKLYQRVETQRAHLQKTDQMQKLSPKSATKLVNHPNHLRAKKIIRAFDQCELKSYAMEEASHYSKEKEEIQKVIDNSIIDSRMVNGLSGIARTEYAHDVIVNAYREAIRQNYDTKKHKIIMIASARQHTAEFLIEHGIDHIPLETFKFKAFLIKSKNEINYINLLNAHVMGNHVEFSKVAALEKRLSKKYYSRVKSK